MRHNARERYSPKAVGLKSAQDFVAMNVRDIIMHMKTVSLWIFSIVGSVLFVIPVSASAATNFEITGWIPYWRTATGTADVLPHLDIMSEVNPFVYTLKSDGTFLDNGNIGQEPWTSFMAAAKAKGVRVIPTIMTGNGDLIHSLLSNTASRIALEDRIANMVIANGFDGIEIDFEGKRASDKDYFSTFLKGLYQRMGQKWVMCDIEARTPPGDLYYGSAIPKDAAIYANDFTAINKYCDRVKLMTYDQQGVDQQLATQAASSSELYAPVADPQWVEKVVNLTKQSIAPSKILIGVPTYGYEYDVTAYAQGQYTYDILWTFNPGYAWPIAQQYGVTPARNKAGELYFTYTPVADGSKPVSLGGASASLAATAAATYADSYNSHLSFRLMDWPDATSIAQKAALAKQLGVRGIAIFKLDGGEDPNIWSVLAAVRGTTASYTPTSATLSVALSRGLDLGSTGEDVRTLQRILNMDPQTQVAQSGVGSPGNETTYFGLATQAAVEKFQVRYGIAAAGASGYGYVGPATRAKLNAILSGA
jgi:spore germination protein YaaH